jgi:transposase
MDLETTFHGLLGLDDSWEVNGVDYDDQQGKFFIVITETDKLWEKETCPDPDCKGSGITCHDHVPTRAWRHLDAFGKRSELLCNLPRGKCPECSKVYRIKAPWEGRGKHFTTSFEGFALALMREMPVNKASKIIGETDQRMWRVLFKHVEAAYKKLDMSDVVWIGADEMNCRKGHDYLTVFADLMVRRVSVATEGKDSGTFEAFVEALSEHNGHPKAITQVAIDMSPAYKKGVRENLGNAQIVFDKFHVVAQVGEAVDKVRRAEIRSDEELRKQLKGTRWIFLKNPQNLTDNQKVEWEELDLKNLCTGIAYQMRLNLQRIYRCRTAETAERKFNEWSEWVRGKAAKIGKLLDPMVKVAAMIERNLVGILAHWKDGLTTGFMEGLNSLFSATKRKARGFSNSVYMITMLYFVAGKLSIPTYSTH